MAHDPAKRSFYQFSGASPAPAAENDTQTAYDPAVQVVGRPLNAAVVMRFVADRAFVLEAAGHRGSAEFAATTDADFVVAVNGSQKAILRFAAGEAVVTVVDGTSATMGAGDLLTVTAPSTQDATLKNIAITLAGRLV